MFKSITIKTIYSILLNTIRSGFKKFTNDNGCDDIVIPRLCLQANSYRTIQLENYLIKQGDDANLYNLLTLIENIYRVIHFEKNRIILFQNKLDYVLATKMSLTHGYNKNILILQERHHLTIYFKAVYAIYEYARNN